jgi:hypothetical protein
VFVRDLQSNITTLASRAAGAAGAKGNSHSFEPAISAGGHFVVFWSFASNLHPDDADTTLDVFRRDVLGPPPSAQPPGDQPPLVHPSPTQPPTGLALPPTGSSLQRRAGCPGAGTLIVGTGGDDERSGGALTDIVLGGPGDDLLRGLTGADCLYGERGADRLLGGSGSDRLWGGRGPDRLLGGGGSDRINPGPGRDRIAAGPGNDRVPAQGNARDAIDCGPGRRDLAIVDRLDVTRNCERVRLG